MALDRLTKVDGRGISTTSDYRVGIITATKFVGPIEGTITSADATFTGNVSIAGTLTYEDVTNVDSVGVITARNGIKVSTGTATTALVVDGDARVTGILTVGTSSLKLDGPNNVVNVGTALTLGHSQGVQFHTQNLHSAGFEVNQINASGIITATGADINGDLDVDGHTNLDNVNVAGIVTFNSGASLHTDGGQILLKDRPDGNSNNLFFGTGGKAVIYHDGTNFSQVNNTGHFFLGQGVGNKDLMLYAQASGNVLLQQNTGVRYVKGVGSDASVQLFFNNNLRLNTTNAGVSIPKDLDVDGHTNLDNVSVAGVTTFSGRIDTDRIIAETNTSSVPTVKITNSGTANQLELYGSATSTILIKATDNGGIPKLQLRDNYSRDNYISVTDSGDNLVLAVDDGNAGADSTMRFRVDGTERVRIASDGKLLLGTTDTGFSGSYTTMTIGNASTQNTGLTIASSPSNGFSRLHFADASSGAAVYAGFIAYSHADDALVFGTNNSGTEKVRIDSSGRLYLGSNFTGGNGDVDDLVISGTGHKGITLCSTSGGITRFTFADGLSGTAAVIGSIAYEHSVDAMDFYTNALRMMRVDRANSTERLQIGAINNNSAGTRLVLGFGNNIAATAVINTQDANINALTLSNWDGSTTTNKVNMHFDASGIASFDVGIPAATTAFKIANTSGGGGYINMKTTGETKIYRSGVMLADINNSVQGHQFISQCTDNNTGFEVYSQHGSTSSRNSFAVFNNSTGSKHNNFYVRGDNTVFISGNKDTVGLVMDGTSSGTAYGETGNTIDFRQLNEVNQFTGNPAARIASYLERGNNGFGLKFYARNSGSSFAAMVQLSPDYQWEPCLDSTVDLGSDALTWRRGYIMNAYPEQGQEQAITGSSFSNGTWYDTGLRRNYVGGLDTNGTYIVTALADLYQAMGGNYSVTYTWIVGLRDQYTNQTLVNSCQLLSVCGHSTNNFGASGATVGDGIRLGTSRQPSSQGGMEKIVWKPAVSTGEINNTDGGRILRFRIQRIGRSSTG